MITGTAPPKSHHIVTLRDLDEPRRPRRLSLRSRCSSSPTDSDPSLPMTLRSGGAIHSRCSLFSSPPRSSNLGEPSPLLSQENSTSPVWNSPPQSNSSISVVPSPHQGAITYSPRGKQNFRITTPVSAEVPQDFLASSETEDAAVATTNGISLAPDNLEEEVAHLMAQELPYTVFDTDTEVAVASMLNAKLEFDESLLAENVGLNCGAQGGRVEVELEADNHKSDSEDEDSSHYSKFSRIVVCDTGVSSNASGQVLSTNSISQLDGADGGSESDETEAVDDEAEDIDGEDGESKIHTNHNAPTRQLTVALKRLESIYSTGEQTAEQEVQEHCPPPDIFHSSYANNDLLLQEEEVQVSCATPTSHNEVLLDSTTGNFVSAEGAAVVHADKNPVDDKDENSSSTESFEPFKDDLNDPDYSPEHTTKKFLTSPTKAIIVNKRHRASNLKHLQSKLCLPQQNRVKLLLPSQSTLAASSAATVGSVPRTVTSPIVLNGLNALPIQAGATRGRTIAIRLQNSKPGSQQQVVIPNQTTVTAPAPQVLLVNRQGQILIKNPRTNTYQSLSANSPAYNKISQIAKILHGSNPLQRTVPRVIIRPNSQLATTNVTPASKHTSEQKVIVRLVPVKTSCAVSPTTPETVLSVPKASVSQPEGNTHQAIIDRAMATYHDKPKTEPIILRKTRRPRGRPPKYQNREDSVPATDVCSNAPSEPNISVQPLTPFSRRQVRVKRVSSLSEKPLRKKSKMDCLRDPDELTEARY